MKKWLYEILMYIFCFVFINLFFISLELPVDIYYLLITLFLVGFGMFFSKHLLVFLTVKVVFLTRLVAMFLILFVVFYALEMFVPGFIISEMVVQEADLSWVSLKSFEFDKISVIALLSFFTALLSSLVKLLEE